MQMAVNKCHRPESGICTSVGGWSPSFTRGREGGSLPGCGGIKGSEHGLPSYLSLACSRPSFHQPGRHEDMDPASVAQLLIQPSSTVQTCRVPVSSKSSSGSACVVCMPEIMPVGGRGGRRRGKGRGGRKEEGEGRDGQHGAQGLGQRNCDRSTSCCKGKGWVSAGRNTLYTCPHCLQHSPTKYCFMHSASVPSCMSAATPLDVAIPLPPRRLASEQMDNRSEARRRAATEAAALLSSAAAAAEFAERVVADAAVVRPRNWCRSASAEVQGEGESAGEPWMATSGHQAACSPRENHTAPSYPSRAPWLGRHFPCPVSRPRLPSPFFPCRSRTGCTYSAPYPLAPPPFPAPVLEGALAAAVYNLQPLPHHAEGAGARPGGGRWHADGQLAHRPVALLGLQHAWEEGKVGGIVGGWRGGRDAGDWATIC